MSRAELIFSCTITSVNYIRFYIYVIFMDTNLWNQLLYQSRPFF